MKKKRKPMDIYRYSVEVAKSDRAKCKECGEAIEKDTTKVVRASFNQWAGRPQEESICKKCGLNLLRREMEMLEGKLQQLEDRVANYDDLRELEFKTGTRMQF